MKKESTQGTEFNTYREGYEINLPTSGNFTRGKLLGWQINGSDKLYTEIPDTITGNITLKAVFAEEHDHKLCGTKEGEVCPHTEIASHSEIIHYEAIDNTIPEDELVNMLQSGGKYHMVSTISFATNRTIEVTDDLYLCLNGYNLINVKFFNNAANKRMLRSKDRRRL